MITPICGEHFCGACGDCLSCYGENTCFYTNDGKHVWPQVILKKPIKSIEQMEKEISSSIKMESLDVSFDI